MFDCNNCKNKDKNKCLENNIEEVKEIQEEIKNLGKKHRHFYGRFIVTCDYFIPIKAETPICNKGE